MINLTLFKTIGDYERAGFEGVDASLDIALFEYGLGWLKRGDEIMFIYGITHNGEGYTRFDTCVSDYGDMSNFDWISCDDLESLCSTNGATVEEWEQYAFEQKQSG